MLANQVRWIRALAQRPDVEEVRVLTPRHGRAELPANVSVYAFGGPPPLQVARASLRFYARLLTMGRGLDWALVAQGGHYPALLLPWKLLTRRPLYQWKAMPHVSRRMRFYARYCDDLIFTATAGSFPLASDKVRVIGHGIDTELFSPPAAPDSPSGDIVVVTRVAEVKRLDQMIRAVAEVGRRCSSTPNLDIVGACDTRSQAHRRHLLRLIEDLDLGGKVRLLGGIDHDQLPNLLAHYRVSLNFAETAFDKAAGEAMASGLPVLTCNPRVSEVIPEALHDRLVVAPDDVAAQAAAIHQALTWGDATRRQIGLQLRQAIVDNHSLDALFTKILDATTSR